MRICALDLRWRLSQGVEAMFPGSGLEYPSREERQRATELTGEYIGGGNRA